MDAQMLIAGELSTGNGGRIEIRDPFRDELVATVPDATTAEVERALAAAEDGARHQARTSGGERAAILERVADLVAAEAEALAVTIVREQGKTLVEARREAGRTADLLRLCAGEARRLGGETVPLDQGADGVGRLGLTLRVPVGVVVAITPFNYPLLLVAHKLGPAFAAGNAVILKPATTTPLSGLRLAQLFAAAGAHPGAMQCLTGSGSGVGMPLCVDERVRAITFTGSEPVGQAIVRAAGVKHHLMELGANCPLIVAADADLAQAAEATAVGGYANAGQACISAQRVLVERAAYDDFLDALSARVGRISAGDPMSEAATMGPLIDAGEAERVAAIVAQAAESGARVVQGGERDGALHAPTVVADVSPDSRLFGEELFGPAVGVTPVDSLDEALALANRSEYGLGAGIFTRDVHAALRFVREIEAGVIQVNWSPLWRADSMPYGGLKRSGIGREGPRWAVEELTELKTVVFHPPPTN
ncbi:MAG TPA: aldehyde dehydrogenase family protein [Conexibacter sp.]|nr:aldehyde dehydrogenase family protein [Conexibacter sp.]